VASSPNLQSHLYPTFLSNNFESFLLQQKDGLSCLQYALRMEKVNIEPNFFHFFPEINKKEWF